jgi:hypothetical protein
VGPSTRVDASAVTPAAVAKRNLDQPPRFGNPPTERASWNQGKAGSEPTADDTHVVSEK